MCDMENQEKKGNKKDTLHTGFHIVLTVLLIAQLISSIMYFNYGRILSLKIVGWSFWAISAVSGWLPIYTLRKRGGVPKGKSYVTTTKLVDTGIYAIVRHPQFLAGMLWSLAFILIAQHWLVLVLGIPIILIWYLGIIEGDKSGIEKFGDDYKRYMQRVPQMNFLVGLIRVTRRTKKPPE